MREIFLRHGLAKPPTRPSGKSSAPEGLLPINLAFRLRDMFGVTSRAEIIVSERGQAEDDWPSFVQSVENALRLLEPATDPTDVAR